MASRISRLLDTCSFHALRDDTRANVAMITALSALPVTVMIGGSIDIALAMKQQHKMQYIVDSALVAAANLANEGDIDTTITNYISANFGDSEAEDLVIDSSVENFFNGRRVEATVTSTVPTSFLPLIGVDSLDVAVSGVASQYVVNTEISLVLDVSSSMNGSRINALKPAVGEFVDRMLDGDAADYTSINIVPFGGTVNIGHLFDAYAVEEDDAIVNPSQSDYDTSNLAEGNYRFTEGLNCLEYDDGDYDTAELESHSRSQVPHFWKWWNFNPYCPRESSAVMLNSNDADALKAHVDGMTLSDGTGMEDGALWGLKSLSPSMRGKLGGEFSDRPFDFDSEITNKVLVLMADGDITAQFRPKDYSYYNTHKNRGVTDPDATTSFSNAGNNQNNTTAIAKGNISSGTDRTIGRFLEACNQAKANGVQVFTIGFQIRRQSSLDILLECASSSGHYYDIEDLDISVAFNKIAAAIDSLRLEQ